MEPRYEEPPDAAMQEARSLERERLRFERQKAALDLRLRRRELGIGRGRSPLKEAIGNPVTLAVVGGILTLLTTTVSNYLTARGNMETEKLKTTLAEQSARETLQADLIKKFVEGGKVEVVRDNLRFLVDSGLIPTYADSIKTYLDSNPGSAPRVGSGVEFSSGGETIDGLLKRNIEDSASRFREYLRGLGFSGLDQSVSVYIFSAEKPPPDGSAVPNAFYRSGTIFIHKSLVTDLSVALREYTHHALFATLSVRPLIQDRIESALADYLPASFLDSPVIGSGLGRLFGLSTDYVRRLDTDAQYDERVRDGAWGAAMWTCRQRVGRALFDRGILPAWTDAMNAPAADDVIAERFGKALSSAPPAVGPCFAQEVSRRHLR